MAQAYERELTSCTVMIHYQELPEEWFSCVPPYLNGAWDEAMSKGMSSDCLIKPVFRAGMESSTHLSGGFKCEHLDRLCLRCFYPGQHLHKDVVHRALHIMQVS